MICVQGWVLKEREPLRTLRPRLGKRGSGAGFSGLVRFTWIISCETGYATQGRAGRAPPRQIRNEPHRRPPSCSIDRLPYREVPSARACPFTLRGGNYGITVSATFGGGLDRGLPFRRRGFIARKGSDVVSSIPQRDERPIGQYYRFVKLTRARPR
jgi:hypothetical protein